jgi:hypothetical protein
MDSNEVYTSWPAKGEYRNIKENTANSIAVFMMFAIIQVKTFSVFLTLIASGTSVPQGGRFSATMINLVHLK